jgi:hypothetical protein
MIQNDAALLQHFVEVWEKVIPEWVDEHKQNLTARNILHRRDVDAAVTIDVVEKYDKTGQGAQITAKGAVPKTFGIKTTSENFTIHQIATGFNINVKDLKASPNAKARLVEIALAEIHEKEDDICLNGDTEHNITGVVDAAQANTNGKIVASGASGNDINNKGKWAGETGTDIYTDVADAISFLDSKYKKNPNDLSWIWSSDYITRGKVYVVAKDTMAADFVVSEDPGVVSYALAPGQNYPIEIYSWSETEIYADEAFVEIAIT